MAAAPSRILAATLSVWAVRFLGYLGGPAPVLTLSEWSRARGAALDAIARQTRQTRQTLKRK